MSGAATAGELRRQVRRWRRGRADARLADVVNDVYVAVLSTLLLGSMLGSVLVNTGALTARTCTAGPCQGARFWAPWLAALGAATLAGALARLFGPVFVAPATASWLLSTPVRRRSLLVGPLLLVTASCAAILGAMTLVATALAGDRPVVVAAMTVGAGLTGALLVGLWTLLQQATGRPVLTAALAWLPGVVLEVALLLTWHGDLHPRSVLTGVGAAGWGALAALVALSIGSLAGAVGRLDRIRDRDLAAGGRLRSGLGGALATLDLALIYDVVVEQRWRRRGQVRSRRGGPTGILALVRLDLVRLRRSPARLVLILAAAPLPYAAKALGAGAAAAPLAVLVGFLVALPLLIGLRVLTRTPGLARMLPFTAPRTQAAALVVPGCCLLVYGLLEIGAAAYPVPIALGSLAAATRWMTGRPPDYGRPLVSTPAGAVPANLYGSVLRGLDIVLLTGLPLLLPHGNGVVISTAASLITLAVLVNRRAQG